MLLRFVYITAWIKSSFLFIDEYHIPLDSTAQFAYPFTCWWTSVVLPVLTTKKATMNIQVQFLCGHTSSQEGNCWTVWLYGKYRFKFIKNWQTGFQNLCLIFAVSLASCERSSCSISLSTIGMVSFLILAIITSEN